MKRFIIISLAAITFAALPISCSKEVEAPKNDDIENPQKEDPTPAKQQITISATLPNNMTKVSFDPTYQNSKPTQLDLKWESGDKLRVENAEDPESYEIFEISSGIGEKKASFSGVVPTGATSFNVSVVHGDVDYKNQTQPADGNTSGLQYIASKSGITDLSTIAFDNINSVLAITAQMPTKAIAATIKSVEITASASIFNNSDTLRITLGTTGDAGDDGILHLFATLPQGDQAITAGTSLIVHFNSTDTDHTVYTRYIELPAQTFTNKKLNTININAKNSASFANASTENIGTSTNPYLIGDKYQMAGIDNFMAHGATKYFKLIDNVDMTGTSWTMLNDHDSVYDQLIDFDGNRKTLSNMTGTMFYVFKGSIKNLTLRAPSISDGAQKGALAQYVQGTGNFITNVDVCDVITFAASSGNCGGLIGRINSGVDDSITATIVDCDVTNVPVNSSGKAGGFIGSVEEKVIITNCTCTGNTVTNTSSHYAGGLIAYATAYIEISKCYTDMVVNGCSGKNRIGGLIGWAQTGSVEQCRVKGDVNNGGYVGGLIGTVSNSVNEQFTISQSCYTDGKVAPTANYGGGLVGTKEGLGRISINDCYVSGTIQADTRQRYGGILAGHIAGTSTLENCYFSGTLSAAACIGGIVGWVETDGLSVTRCMPFPTSLHAVQSVASADRYCSGLVIGYARKDVSAKVVVNHCYRTDSIALNFSDYPGVAGTNVVENHEFITVAAQIPQRHDLQYGYYHHGQLTSSSTLSQLVQRNDIGGAWNGDIWDFSLEYPRLKWMLD